MVPFGVLYEELRFGFFVRLSLPIKPGNTKSTTTDRIGEKGVFLKSVNSSAKFRAKRWN